MFLVNTLMIDGGKHPGFELGIAFLGAVWLIGVLLMAWKLSDTANPDVKFLCKTGLHICYIQFVTVIFIMAVPNWVSNMEEAGNIALSDASLYTAGIIAMFQMIWNVVGIVFSVCWHFTKKRKEMSELERMKLEDL